MRTIRSVLVHVDATPSSAARFEFARAFALRRQAAMSAMFVAWPSQPPIHRVVTGRRAAPPRLKRAAADYTTSMFDNKLAESDPPIRWLESSDADTVEAFCRQALYVDLLVLGQHDPSTLLPGNPRTGFLESVLIATDKPALILPYEGGFETAGRNVVIGWNATPEAARAFTAALPWLRNARHVHVLEAVDESEQRHVGDLDIAQYLRSHGIAATPHRHHSLLTDAGEVLLSLASEVGADLLVMACCRHSRLRELMLGGASRGVLRTMTLPVLMAH